jgi:hypothetical protein
MIAGCGSGARAPDSASNASGAPPSQPQPAPAPAPAPTPAPLSISGTPSTTAPAGAAYSFSPSASGPAGTTLAFSIKNAPPWAVFNSTTGQLSGTPSAANTGVYSNIVITVNDGASTMSLAPFSVTVPVANATATLATKYPGDVGIGADPAVIWNENFSEGSVATVAARYPTVVNTGGMALVADIPVNNAASTKSISMISGGTNDTTYLYKNFSQGYDEIYVRWYAKYVTQGPWHHVGMVFGGYNPSLSYPNPRAGQKPAGNDSFHIYYEPNSGAAYNNWTDFYNYFMQMHSFDANPVQGDYFGNQLVNNPASTTYDANWHCYEIHLKLNTDLTSSTGAILELWIDNQPIIRYDDAGMIVGGGSEELGYWTADKFCYLGNPSSICAPYNPGSGYITLNQQYRTTESLQTNFMWLENYSNYPTNNEVRYSNVVFATQRIGAIVQ